MSRADLRRWWDRLGPLGAAAVVCLLAAGALGMVFVWTVAGALLMRAPGGAAASAAEEADRIERFEASTGERLAQINGRSLFHTPPAPSEAEAAEAPEEAAAAEEEAPRPVRYGGPEVIAVINDTVWLRGDRYVRVGEESGGVRVVSVDGSPWSVRLEWRGVEFDVEVFERTTGEFLKDQQEGS
jgi:hypothetical protein